MIISVHMPKSGGTSFRHLLKNRFPKSTRGDYDHPIHDSEQKRHLKIRFRKLQITLSSKLTSEFDRVDCIHGHFMPFKYEHFYQSGGHIFVTWLRDPIERIESHYHYWKRHHDEIDQLPFLKKFIEEEWPLEKFAFAEEIRNIYSIYLWNFPVERFDFIGVTEFFEEDLSFFAENYLGIPQASIPEKNINLKKDRRTISDPGLIRELKEFHAEDYKLYRYALDLRPKR